jgi:putative phosphoesterase
MKIAIISDIHANLPAFKKVLKDIEREKCEHVFILGDLIGYYFWPKEVLEIIYRIPNKTIIRGNHEDILLKCKKSKLYLDKVTKKYGIGFKICLEQLNDFDFAWIEGLPRNKATLLDGIKFMLFHGSDKDTNEYIYPDSNSERLIEFNKLDCDYIFYGHTHYQVVFDIEDKLVVNPGSVGQSRDYGSQACYSLFNTKSKALIQKRLTYNTDEILKKAIKTNCDNKYLVEILKRNNFND